MGFQRSTSRNKTRPAPAGFFSSVYTAECLLEYRWFGIVGTIEITETEQNMTFTEILDNPETRDQVDAIEDVISSLRGRESDPELNRILASMVNDLEAQTGFRYDISE